MGCEKAVKLMQADTWDQELLEDLCTVMADASISSVDSAADRNWATTARRITSYNVCYTKLLRKAWT